MSKIINLILYNISNEYDKMKDILKNYLQKVGIEYYFYCYDENIESDYVIKDNVIYIKGKETYLPGIFKKTIDAIEICLQFDFDYIVRTNASTIVDCEYLKDYLNETKIQYGGAETYVINWIDHSCGIHDQLYKGQAYIHGTAIILSRDMAKLIVANKHSLNYSVIDDVGIGIFYKTQNIFPEPIKNGYVYLKNARDITYKGLFYRNKRRNREDDVRAMENITKKILSRTPEQKRFVTKNNMSDKDNTNYAYYGCGSSYFNVLDIVYNNFIIGNKLTIPIESHFNSFFGDPSVGKPKKLIMRLNKKNITVNEARKENILLII